MANVIRKLVDATVIIDDVAIGYTPNSLSYTEGFGENKVRTQTSGGGHIQRVVAQDASKMHSDVKFKMEPTADNVEVLRAIKANLDGHVITLSAPNFTRTITGAILISDYEVKFGIDDTIDLHFTGNAAV